jgi:T4-like virus Myoviridae tail sheath stabiliser
MQHFYDGQIRRYLLQTIRVFSNFVVKFGDGALHRVPVMYGDSDRQAASVLRQNSENVVNSAPRIAIYVTNLELDRERLSDSTYVGKLHIRERDIENGGYTQGQGRNYTVERLMPTPFKLTMKADIWATSTDQKLQILEQILVLFNPSLELQTTDNYIDWTSLSVLNLTGTSWSSRTVPSGTDTPIDIATLTLETPIWISPPVKVKHLGVITNIITSIYSDATNVPDRYIEGLGIPLTSGTDALSGLISQERTTITDYDLQVYGSRAILFNKGENTSSSYSGLDIPTRPTTSITWPAVFELYPKKFINGSSMLFLRQPDGSEVVGTAVVNPLDDTLLEITWDQATYPLNNGIDSNGNIQRVDIDFDANNTYSQDSPGVFHAIVNPQTTGPSNEKLPAKIPGRRYLLVDDIGNLENDDGADAWKGEDGSDLIAQANDIVEWSGVRWNVIFNSNQKSDILIYQTNIYTGVQYKWDGIVWTKSFEGEYKTGLWRLEL